MFHWQRFSRFYLSISGLVGFMVYLIPCIEVSSANCLNFSLQLRTSFSSSIDFRLSWSQREDFTSGLFGGIFFSLYKHSCLKVGPGDLYKRPLPTIGTLKIGRNSWDLMITLDYTCRAISRHAGRILICVKSRLRSSLKTNFCSRGR